MNLIGPNSHIDTNRFSILSFNVLGGCDGSTGPTSIASSDWRVRTVPLFQNEQSEIW